ncbi:MAG: hypothetical protein FJW32_03005 [Acidobacteria bacterium]|nr:hypothetical protein [Acidobacteriota bacterium]
MRRKFLIRCGLMVALGLVVYAGLWAYAIATKTNGEQKLAALAAEAGSRGGTGVSDHAGGQTARIPS